MRKTRRAPKNAHKALVQKNLLQITRSRGAANPHSCSRGTTRPTPCVHETHSTRSQGALFWYFGIRSQGADTHTRRNHTAQGAAGIHGMPCPSLHAHEALVSPFTLTRRLSIPLRMRSRGAADYTLTRRSLMKTKDPTNNIRFVAAKKLLLAAGFSVRGLKPTGHALPGFDCRNPVPSHRRDA
jgi:hypothetical protein